MYRVVKCGECKTLQLSSAHKIFSCITCHKSKDISKVKTYFESRTPQEAQEVLKELKKQKAMLSNSFEEPLEFFSANQDNKNL